jgi:hypothetical protein
MSTLLTSRPRVRDHAASQESLFGDWGERPAAPVATPARPELPAHERGQRADPARERADAVAAPVPASGPTLAAAVTSLWDQLATGQPTACPICDAAMDPVRSATTASDVVGGRCGSCGSTLS